MMCAVRALPALLAAGLAFGSPARAQAPATDTPGLVITPSAHTMAETEARLLRAMDAAGLKLAFRVDHAANARGVDLSLPPTVLLVFGNPRSGTPLMQENRLVGIDLPLKMLIWEEGGAIKLAYTDVDALAQRHGLGQGAVLAAVAQVLQTLATAATAP